MPDGPSAARPAPFVALAFKALLLAGCAGSDDPPWGPDGTLC